MKDSYEKDPFAEYDKYWDNLDEKEKEVNQKQEKMYGFKDIDQKRTNKQSVLIPEKYHKFIIAIIGVAALFFFGKTSFISPFIIFIVIAVGAAYFDKKS